MTETEWLASEEPDDLLEPLRGKVSDRALRLFAVASCRWAWDYLTPEERQIVQAVEECIDTLLGEVGMGLAARTPIVGQITVEKLLVRDLAQGDAWEAARSVAFQVPRLVCGQGEETWTRGYKAVSQIVREVFGNPFRPPPFNSDWRTTSVVDAARAAYSDRELPSGKLHAAPIAKLADALEKAGCSDPDLLGHLRGPGPHVRGCWAVGLLLGRE